MDEKRNRSSSSGKSASPPTGNSSSSGSPGFAGNSRSRSDCDDHSMTARGNRTNSMSPRSEPDSDKNASRRDSSSGNSRADPTYGSENLNDNDKGKLRS